MNNMKKITGVSLLLIITGGWLYVSFLPYSGLNSLQNLAGYRTGLLGMKAPASAKQQEIKGVAANATIDIDTLGVPHIFGNDLNSVAYAIGYMHAKDRYFQMELTARTANGSLAEMLGEAGVNSDRQWKRFELAQKAKTYLDELNKSQPALYAYLKAYGEGVNAYVASEKPANRDPMYTVWNYTPAAWKTENVFLIQWYMSEELTFYDDYIDKQEVIDKIPAGIRQLLYPEHPENQPTIIPGIMSKKEWKENGIVKLFKPGQTNNYEARAFDRSLGSNNWVVGKSRTRDRELFLANDLHLSLCAPNILYELHLVAPGLHAYGYSIPGVPLIVTGHNENIAWGITNGGWDVTEQYMLKLNPQNRDQYWLDGKWTNVEKKEFQINIKDNGSQKMTVDYTVFGPMVRKDSVQYGLKWHPAASCRAVESFWKLMQAANWNDFSNALRTYDYPSQNFVYGDIQGNIGMICAGKMPVKPADYNGGLFDGTRSVTTGYIPFDSLPRVFNPGQDYLFSANQEPGQEKNYFSSRWFDDLSRPRRIDQLLSANRKMSREDLRLMQTDIVDVSVDSLRVLLDKYASGKKLSSNWEAMRNWNGELTPGSQQAIFYKSYRRATRFVCRNLAKKLQVKAWPGYDQLMHFLLSGDSMMVSGEKVNSKDCFNDLLRISDSLYAKLSDVEKKNAYVFDIPQMTFLPGLNTPVEQVGGSENTINVNYSAHPVIRTLVEFQGNDVQSWMVNATGQTGRINRKDYFQQLSSWKRNELHKTQFTSQRGKLQAITNTVVFTGKEH